MVVATTAVVDNGDGDGGRVGCTFGGVTLHQIRDLATVSNRRKDQLEQFKTVLKSGVANL
ncbi:hypothetical protein BVC80_1209g21 [Macleaya cordata]|uniref:Uncharacterized protein n=1 Tax=Macleaya cordata TaxID=56857 RepID=A0A200RCN1_MACCD|nr:hypothetical protein BVC80_1209g21 [Macleaya cordata]